MALELTAEVQDDLAVVSLYGNVCPTDAEVLNNTFDRLATADHAAIILDFQDLASINSTGLAAIAALVRRLLASDKKGGDKSGGDKCRMILCHVNARILYLLQLSGLDRFVKIMATREEAMAHTRA